MLDRDALLLGQHERLRLRQRRAGPGGGAGGCCGGRAVRGGAICLDGLERGEAARRLHEGGTERQRARRGAHEDGELASDRLDAAARGVPRGELGRRERERQAVALARLQEALDEALELPRRRAGGGGQAEVELRGLGRGARADVVQRGTDLSE